MRARRNKDAKFTDVAGGVQPPAARGWSKTWAPAARDWWRAVKGSSVAEGYNAGDWQVALRCAQMIADAETLREGKDYVGAKSLLTEVRQIEDRLLVTVRARRSARVKEDKPVSPTSKSRGKGPDYLEVLKGKK